MNLIEEINNRFLIEDGFSNQWIINLEYFYPFVCVYLFELVLKTKIKVTGGKLPAHTLSLTNYITLEYSIRDP